MWVITEEFVVHNIAFIWAYTTLPLPLHPHADQPVHIEGVHVIGIVLRYFATYGKANRSTTSIIPWYFYSIQDFPFLDLKV